MISKRLYSMVGNSIHCQFTTRNVWSICKISLITIRTLRARSSSVISSFYRALPNPGTIHLRLIFSGWQPIQCTKKLSHSRLSSLDPCRRCLRVYQNKMDIVQNSEISFVISINQALQRESVLQRSQGTPGHKAGYTSSSPSEASTHRKRRRLLMAQNKINVLRLQISARVFWHFLLGEIIFAS